MNTSEGPRVFAASVLDLVREGGFAALPGLERPRRIVCRELNAHQRTRLQALLDDIERRGDVGGPDSGGADSRRFRLTLELPEDGVCWRCELAESVMPATLVGLWKHGPGALEE